MTRSLRFQPRIAFFTLICAIAASLLYAAPARGDDDDDDDEDTPAVRRNACLTLDQPGAADALEELRKLAPEVASLRGVTLAGLTTLDEGKLWVAIGGKPAGTVTAEEAAALVGRLRETGLFARVDSLVKEDSLEVKLVENPTLRTVELRGLREVSQEEAMAALVQQPSSWRWAEEDHRPRRRRPRKSRRSDCDDQCRRRGCPPAEVPRELLAQADGAALRPGILWRGLTESRERRGRHLRSEGYLLSSFTGSITSDGTLVIYLDEGQLEALDLLGVHPALRDEVLRELGLATGEVFSVGTVRSALARVRHRWPFLHADGSLRPLPQEVRVVVEDVSWGGSKFHLAPPARTPPEERKPRESNWSRLSSSSWDELDDPDFEGFSARFRQRRQRAVEVDGQRVRVHLRAARTMQ